MVELRREGCELALRIRNNGVEIAPGLVTRIFDLFVQVRRRVKHSRGGVGIGLTLVQKLVEWHGGTVEVRARGPTAAANSSSTCPRRPTSVANGPWPSRSPTA